MRTGSSGASSSNPSEAVRRTLARLRREARHARARLEALAAIVRATGSEIEPGRIVALAMAQIALLTVEGQSIDVYDDGTFTAVVRMKHEGKNDITIVAQDSAGNENRLRKSVFVEAF